MYRGMPCYAQSGTRTLPTLVAIIVVLAFWIGASPVTVQASATGDTEITYAVQSRLSALVPDAMTITVATENGIVRLSGTLDSKYARERTILLAGTIKGVRSVAAGGLKLAVVDRTDSDITDDVESALGKNPSTKNLDLIVHSNDGLITLIGSAGSSIELEEATHAAESVPGVRAVINHIEITKPDMRSDSEIKKDIKQWLAADDWLQAKSIDVAVTSGTVRLTGAVGDNHARTRAIAGSWVVGVTDVDGSALRVDPSLANASLRSSEAAAVPDDRIRDAIVRAVTADPATSSSRIEPFVANGVVTLFGEASSLEARDAAMEVAQNTLGTRWARDMLAIDPASLTDDRMLANRVELALVNDPYIDTTAITVHAQSGIVTLTGEANTEFEREHALAIAAATPGVVEVTTRVDFVYEAPFVSEAELKRDIEQYLAGLITSPDEQVDVAVKHRIATLKGAVRSEDVRAEAEEAAFISGARDVQNRIIIEPERVSPVRVSGVAGEP